MKPLKFLPSPSLQPFIREYILLETGHALASKTIPDTSMVMSFRFRGRVWRKDDGEELALPEVTISGLRNNARVFQYAAQTANLLVVLKPGGIAAFTRMPANSLFGQGISGDDLFLANELKDLLDQLASTENNRQRIRHLETFLRNEMNGLAPDPMVAEAVNQIELQSGNLPIRELARRLYISQDAFGKRFRSHVGASPKQYASILRMRRLVGSLGAYPSLTSAAHAAGFFDQAHFIKSFRVFTGQPPKAFLRSGEYW